MADEESEALAAAPPAPSLRVLHVVDRDVFVRFGRMIRHVALALSTEGLRVSLLTDDAAAAADLDGTPIACRHLGHLSGWRAWSLPQQLERWPDPRPDIVHLWGTTCLRSVGRWALRAGIRVLAHALSVQDVERLARRPRAGLMRAAGCAGLAELLGKHTSVAAGQFAVLPPGLLMPEMSDDGQEDQAAERTLGIIWAGRIDEHAGLETLVDAVAQLRGKDCDLQVALVGAGPGVQTLWQRMRDAQVHHCITLVHETRSWDSAMRGADLCVVPARQHELSLAPLLAMAHGKVVLSSRDQIAEWFVEDETTWQFTPGSAVELAYHLARVAEGHRLARELRRSAAAYVRQHHTIGGLVTKLIAVYGAAGRNSDSASPPGHAIREDE